MGILGCSFFAFFRMTGEGGRTGGFNIFFFVVFRMGVRKVCPLAIFVPGVCTSGKGGAGDGEGLARVSIVFLVVVGCFFGGVGRCSRVGVVFLFLLGCFLEGMVKRCPRVSVFIWRTLLVGIGEEMVRKRAQAGRIFVVFFHFWCPSLGGGDGDLG